MEPPIAALVALVGLLVAAGAAAKAPQLARLAIPENLVKGTTYRLTCSVAIGDPPLAFEWQKNGVRLFSTANTVITQAEHTSTVTFKSLSEGDAGEYRCEAVNLAGKAAVEARLQVNVAPFWIQEPFDMDVEEGQLLKIPCHAGGSPAPTYRWSKGSQLLTRGRYEITSDGALTVGAAKKIDAGIFLCEVSNTIAPMLLKQATVRVYVRPRVKLPHTLIQVERGGTVNITCAAAGDHPISVEWRREGQTLPESSSDKILLGDKEQEQLFSNLVIREASAEHAGRYVCSAKNSFGEDQAEARLVVREPPEVPDGIEVSGVWSRSARVTWATPQRVVVTGYGVWFWSHRDLKKFNISVPGSSTTVQISKLHPATEYKLYVIAYNDVGPSEQSRTVTVRTKDEQPSEAPSSVQVISTGPNHAVISWAPPPESEWNSESLTGYLVGYKAASQDSNRPYSFHTVGPDQSTYTLRGLMKYTLYGVVVKAVNGIGYSPPSSEVSFYTEDGDYLPPPQLHLKALDGQSATLRWSSPSPKVTGYTIYSRQGEQSVWDETFIDNPAQNTYQLTGLNLNEYYQIYMVAHTNLGKTEPSDVLSIRVPDPSKSPQTTDEGTVDRAEVRQVLYTVVPLVCLLLVIVALLSASAVYMYAKKSQPPPPPVNADYDFCFTNIPGGQQVLPGMTMKMNQYNAYQMNPYATYSRQTARKKSVNSTPYSTIPRSEKSSENAYAIYESIQDLRSLKRRQSLSRQFGPTMHKVDICDI
ncbi:Down syndrome cell adhesion molecule protein Dscam2-like [Tropilaelaps mercedesae]|uniref:Down syndrome cell adhesion molecule protein Dscam2-like n=1 Tax=Tropilaelaps mercedesae TaxID=418985 RepID=A0A1V9XB93_9ACAR|nr:Down syndrome cell adhesion molecule protein Dscam2-like [Tropilaelaps mercedesae]